MKKPVLEVIRFEEADIVTASGLGGLGFTADYFGNEKLEDGIFSFFGGTGTVTAVTTGAGDGEIVSAFKSYFGGPWSSTQDIWVNGSYGEEAWNDDLHGIINKDRADTVPDWLSNLSKYNGTYYYSRDGRFYSN